MCYLGYFKCHLLGKDFVVLQHRFTPAVIGKYPTTSPKTTRDRYHSQATREDGQVNRPQPQTDIIRRQLGPDFSKTGESARNLKGSPADFFCMQSYAYQLIPPALYWVSKYNFWLRVSTLIPPCIGFPNIRIFAFLYWVSIHDSHLFWTTHELSIYPLSHVGVLLFRHESHIFQPNRSQSWQSISCRRQYYLFPKLRSYCQNATSNVPRY